MGWVDEPHWDDPEGQMFDYDGSPSKLSIKCKYCDITGLHWVRIEKRWKLYDTKDNPHFCMRPLGKIV